MKKVSLDVRLSLILDEVEVLNSKGIKPTNLLELYELESKFLEVQEELIEEELINKQFIYNFEDDVITFEVNNFDYTITIISNDLVFIYTFDTYDGKPILKELNNLSVEGLKNDIMAVIANNI